MANRLALVVHDAEIPALLESPSMTPDVIDHPQLGHLTWDPSVHWYEGSIVLATGETARINFSPFANLLQPYPEVLDGIDAFLARCVAYVGRVESRLEEYWGHAADHLLENYNKNWRNSYQHGREVELPELDRAGFMSKLTVDSIGFDDPSGGELFFHDGGLFAGHSVTVSVDEHGEPDDCSLFG